MTDQGQKLREFYGQLASTNEKMVQKFRQLAEQKITYVVTRRTCGECAYYESRDGECLRHAPRIVGEIRVNNWGRFPAVAVDGWCGDFAPKEES